YPPKMTLKGAVQGGSCSRGAFKEPVSSCSEKQFGLKHDPVATCLKLLFHVLHEQGDQNPPSDILYECLDEKEQQLKEQ
uniref:Uncharacterized protein n=1 Tax=Stegastes partitus TaxID=144197 RepID=A0A3B5AUS0_9TELE